MIPAVAAPATTLDLPPEMAELTTVFPYHFLFTETGRLRQLGPKLAAWCPRAVSGEPVGEWFVLEQPAGEIAPAGLAALRGHLVLLRCRANGSLLRGQFLPAGSAGGGLFLGSPWHPATAPEDARLEEFGIHDPGIRLLLALRRQSPDGVDLQPLTEYLVGQRGELRRAKQELEQRNQALANALLATQRDKQQIQLLSLMAARTHNLVAITDARLATLWVNESFVRISGYTLAEANGREPLSLLAGTGTTPGVLEELHHQSAARGRATAEVQLHHKSGRPFWLLVDHQSVRNIQNEITHFLILGAETTERRATEAALRSERELLWATLNRIVDGVIVVDQEQRVQLLNPVAERYTGCASSAARDCPLGEIFPPGDELGRSLVERITQAFTSRAVTGTVHDPADRFLVRTLLGRRLTIVAAAIPTLDDQGQVTGGLVVFRDLSAEIAAEQIRQDFVRTVSHELNTPLTSLSGFVRTLREQPELPRKLREEFLDIMHRQTNRLQSLVQDILEISRSESGEEYHQQQALDLRVIIEASLQEAACLAAERSVRFVATLPCEPVRFNGDAMRLQSVSTNLLTNAIKFSPAGGEVRIDLRDEDRTIKLVVQDFGLGIPAEEHEHIFERFYRVRRPGTQIPGTGLGLAIVRRVVNHYGGQIHVLSAPGEGATFTVTLPTIPQGPRPPG